jgi:hypothetical protein
VVDVVETGIVSMANLDEESVSGGFVPALSSRVARRAPLDAESSTDLAGVLPVVSLLLLRGVGV